MSNKSSFREAFERREETRGASQEQSDFPGIKLLLRPRTIRQPVAVAKALREHGASLRKAHETLNRLSQGERVAIELPSHDPSSLIAELAALGVQAGSIRAPDADPKAIREKLGISQAEFALRYCLELDTLQDWEQGRSRLDAAARLLLKLIEVNSELVDAVIAAQADHENG